MGQIIAKNERCNFIYTTNILNEHFNSPNYPIKYRGCMSDVWKSQNSHISSTKSFHKEAMDRLFINQVFQMFSNDKNLDIEKNELLYQLFTISKLSGDRRYMYILSQPVITF